MHRTHAKRRGPSSSSGIAGILLAAGESRRLGVPKQLLDINDEPMVTCAVRQALDHCDAGLVVVTGAAGDAVAAALADWPVEIVHNSDWRQGMGVSISRGVSASAPDAAALLLMVCDQPDVGAAELAQLAETWRGARDHVVAAAYGDISGVPAIFPAALRGQLAALTGDCGARAIIAAAERKLDVDMPAALRDIDTPEDAQAWRDRVRK